MFTNKRRTKLHGYSYRNVKVGVTVKKIFQASMSAKAPLKRRSIASPTPHSYQQQQSVSAAKRATSPVLLRLATAQAGTARRLLEQNQTKDEAEAGQKFIAPNRSPAAFNRRQSQQQQQQQHYHSPGVQFSTPAARSQQQHNRVSQTASSSLPKRVPTARKSTDLLRIRDPDLRCLAILNSPMIDARPRGRRSLANRSASRHSICCLPASPAGAATQSPMRPPRLTQPAGEDGTSPQAVWRTLFCCDDVLEADEEEQLADSVDKLLVTKDSLEEAVGKYRMLLHQQYGLLRFLIDDWKEVAASESVPPALLPNLEAALASVGRLTRDIMPRFEASLASAGSAEALHSAWSSVQADIVDSRRQFAELEASRLGGWPPLSAAMSSATVTAAAAGVGGPGTGHQRQTRRSSLRVA